MSIVLFLVVLALLIFVHELGHFIIAKLSGIRVDEFAIGFPPRILRFKKGETLYTLNLIPFGGFVKIYGENPNEDSLRGPESPRSFARKPRYIQAAVLVAGVGFNILFAWPLMSAALLSGIPIASGYETNATLQNQKIIVTAILPNSPAERAGFTPGDEIVSVSASRELFTEGSSQELREFIGTHSEETLSFSIIHRGEEKTLRAKPENGLATSTKVVGISLADVGLLKLPLGEAIVEGVKLTKDVTYVTAVSMFEFIKSAFVGKADLTQVTGPVGIVGLVGEASHSGAGYLLSFVAQISVSLAIINLLPFPALDGGRLAVVLIEAVIRRPLNYRYVNIANAIGFILLILLMVVVSYHDILRLITS